MTDQAGTVPGGDPSPFPAAYGPVGGGSSGEPDDGVEPGTARTRIGPRRAKAARPGPAERAAPPRPSPGGAGASPGAVGAPATAATTGPVSPVRTVPVVGSVLRPVRLDAKGRPEASRRLIRRFDTWTVFKVSLVFYLLMLVIVLVAGIAVWGVAVNLGFIKDIDKAVRSLADARSFTLHPRSVLGYTALVGAILAVVGTLLNVVAALLYNLISDVIGGVQVVVVSGE